MEKYALWKVFSFNFKTMKLIVFPFRFSWDHDHNFLYYDSSPKWKYYPRYFINWFAIPLACLTYIGVLFAELFNPSPTMSIMEIYTFIVVVNMFLIHMGFYYLEFTNGPDIARGFNCLKRLQSDLFKSK